MTDNELVFLAVSIILIGAAALIFIIYRLKSYDDFVKRRNARSESWSLNQDHHMTIEKIEKLKKEALDSEPSPDWRNELNDL